MKKKMKKFEKILEFPNYFKTKLKCSLHNYNNFKNLNKFLIFFEYINF